MQTKTAGCLRASILSHMKGNRYPQIAGKCGWQGWGGWQGARHGDFEEAFAVNESFECPPPALGLSPLRQAFGLTPPQGEERAAGTERICANRMAWERNRFGKQRRKTAVHRAAAFRDDQTALTAPKTSRNHRNPKRGLHAKNEGHPRWDIPRRIRITGN